MLDNIIFTSVQGYTKGDIRRQWPEQNKASNRKIWGFKNFRHFNHLINRRQKAGHVANSVHIIDVYSRTIGYKAGVL